MQDRADIEKLFLAALEYEQVGDVYHAVKLYKKIIREAPDHVPPYRQLANLYKRRQEWKPCYYYAQCVLDRAPEDLEIWRTLGIVATARSDWMLARQAWNKFGYNFREINVELDLEMGGIAICLNPETKPEIVWAQRIDPARARIISVPQPSSGLRHKDIVLVDHEIGGHRIVGRKRVPIYPALGVWKKSTYTTYSILLEVDSLEQLDILSDLCRERGLGFDNWSLTTRERLSSAEAYGQSIHATDNNIYLVALSGLRKVSVRRVLRDWQVITLQPLGKLHKHGSW